MKHTQHAPSTIVSEAEARRVVGLINAMDNPWLPRHMELYHSNTHVPIIATARATPGT